MREINAYYAERESANKGELEKYGKYVPVYSPTPMEFHPEATRIKLDILEDGDKISMKIFVDGYYDDDIGEGSVLIGGKIKTITGVVKIVNSICGFLETDRGDVYSITPLIEPNNHREITLL